MVLTFREHRWSESLSESKRDCPDFPSFFLHSSRAELESSGISQRLFDLSATCLARSLLTRATEDYPVTYGAIEMLGKGRKETERNGAGGGKGEEMRRL